MTHTIQVFKKTNKTQGAHFAASEIAQVITENNQAGRPTVLGLATGSSVIGVYQELIRLHRVEGLSFKRVVTFNLDEYYGLEETHVQSYRYFMQQQLFDHIDIQAEHTFVPSGKLSQEAIPDFCQAYEDKIESYGGLDLQLLGIGRNGHIGFNEPGSKLDSRTRLITLDSVTRQDAAGDFNGIDLVPTHAITMGIRTILDARRILMLAWSQAKAPAVKAMLQGPVSADLPASYLQTHTQVHLVLDADSASLLD